MSDPPNIRTQRVKRGAVLLSTYPQSAEEAVIEALADLRHLCHGRKWSYHAADRQARARFLSETLAY